jgi:hypothetical protein
MGTETMNTSSVNSNSDSTILAVPKLRDDGSNWSDYYPRIQNAMGAKGLWRHVLGTATAPVPYVVSQGKPILSDGKTPATEDQIEAKESKIIEFEKREYLSRHILLSTTSTRLGAKIKDLSTAEAMWKVVTDDATQKSTLYLLDAEDQLTSMKLADDEDPKTHLSELKQHFSLMLQRRDNLIKIGSTMSESRFNIVIMSSLPASYRPTLQTITASERMSKLSGFQSNAMKADDLIAFIIEEAQHRVINDERTKSAESALAARTKGAGKSKEGQDNSISDVKCDNCKKPGHTKEQCYSKGGDKEGQGPRQRKKAKESETAVVAANDEEGELFTFTCMLDHAAVAEELEMTKSRLGRECIDRRASNNYRPDRTKFTNYNSIQCQRTPARALNSKPPYETSKKIKPNLTASGIQEFGDAPYIKDLNARKLDARTTTRWFAGYDSESKGYTIYWPNKRSVSVERNVVFNPNDVNSTDDVAVIRGEAQSEGEKEKVIQTSPKGIGDVEKPVQEPENKPSQLKSTQDDDPVITPTTEPSTNIPTEDANPESDLVTPDDEEPSNQEYSRGKRTRRPKRGRPRGTTHTEFADQETAVAAIDSAFRVTINLANHDLRVKQATGVRDRQPIGVQPSEKQLGDSIINIHSVKKIQTGERTSTVFLTFKRVQTTGETLEALNDTETADRNTLVLSYTRRRRNKSVSNSNTNDYLQGSSGFSNRKRRRFVKGAWLEKRAVSVDNDEDSRRSKWNTYRLSRMLPTSGIFTKSLARSGHQELMAKLELRRREEKGVG